MRVRVDASTCQGHARCLMIAPQNFGFIDDDGIATVTAAEIPIEDQDAVEDAAIECPTGAIHIDAGDNAER